MDTLQILCTLCDVKTFLGVFPSDLLQHFVTQPGTIIVNYDPHMEEGSQWLAINFQTKSFSGFYFVSYGLHPYFPPMRSLLKCTCYVWNLKKPIYKVWLVRSVANTAVFCSLPGPGYSSKQFISLFDPTTADEEVAQMFTSEFGSSRKTRGPRGGQCCTCYNKG